MVYVIPIIHNVLWIMGICVLKRTQNSDFIVKIAEK